MKTRMMAQQYDRVSALADVPILSDFVFSDIELPSFGSSGFPFPVVVCSGASYSR
jgi:hypothetical protein